jgi:RNA polymerase sigma-70 factor, ECF subfamily
MPMLPRATVTLSCGGALAARRKRAPRAVPTVRFTFWPPRGSKYAEPCSMATPDDEQPRGPDPDRDLVDRSRAGDSRAFDELVRRYRDAIVGLVRRYVKAPDDAEDVAQKAFVRAFEKIEGFRGESSFRTWLHRIAVNLALNHIRGQDRLQPLELDDVAAFTGSLGTERLVAAEVWRKVHERLAELPPKQRLVVELRLFHELSFKEVAAVADCSEDSAKMNYHHAVKKLRALLPNVRG